MSAQSNNQVTQPTPVAPATLERMLDVQTRQIALRDRELALNEQVVSKGHEFNVQHDANVFSTARLVTWLIAGIIFAALAALVILIMTGHGTEAKEVFVPVLTLIIGGVSGFFTGRATKK